VVHAGVVAHVARQSSLPAVQLLQVTAADAPDQLTQMSADPSARRLAPLTEAPLYSCGSRHTSAAGRHSNSCQTLPNLAELIHPVEYGAVCFAGNTQVESAQLTHELILVVGGDGLEELDVLCSRWIV
jgi:hypothetical protein